MIHDPFLGEPANDEQYVWAQWQGTDFLIRHAQYLERVAGDGRRPPSVRMDALERAKAIREELACK